VQGNNSIDIVNPGTTSVHTAFNGVMLGILLFVGFEAAASLGEESHDPGRSIPRALIGTVAASAAFYCVMAYAISVGLGKAAIDQGTLRSVATDCCPRSSARHRATTRRGSATSSSWSAEAG